jgi:hypothetical protein
MIEKFDLSFLNLEEIIKVLSNSPRNPHGLIENGYSSYNFGRPILEHPELFGLRTIIQKKLNEYTEKRMTIINSWFNVTNPGGVLKKHMHEDSVLSGAFYVKVGKNSCPLLFENTQIKPYNGLLIIFPSTMLHYTEKEIEERVVISFNSKYHKS